MCGWIPSSQALGLAVARLRMIDIMKWLEKERERDAELSHERNLAFIRTESHALRWNGPSENSPQQSPNGMSPAG
jgi:hypothetical protein